MKYIIICVVALIVCFAIGALITFLVGRKKKLKRWKKVVLTIVLGIVLMLIAAFVYLQIYYHADDEAKKYLESGSTVTVTETSNGYLFDGPGEGSAVIFYPGAKVEGTAYAPLLHKLAEEGVDCFLVEMPFRMAIFGQSRADSLIEEYDYENWYMAGHSMGGMCAANYAAAHDEIKGLVLLASYSTKELRNDLKVLSVYGSEDGCLDRGAYEKNKANLPAGFTEVIIEGGNHAYFGNYGEQSGDGKALINSSEQQERTVDAVLEMIGK